MAETRSGFPKGGTWATRDLSAAEARFRSAAEMVALWRGLDLPAWKAPYVLRDARLGYINGYERALVSGGLSLEKMAHAAEARWGKDWRKRLDAVRKRAG